MTTRVAADGRFGNVTHDYVRLLDDAASARIAAGTVYGALVAATSRAAGATLLTLDHRARRTYQAMGATHRFLG